MTIKEILAVVDQHLTTGKSNDPQTMMHLLAAATNIIATAGNDQTEIPSDIFEGFSNDLRRLSVLGVGLALLTSLQKS